MEVERSFLHEIVLLSFFWYGLGHTNEREKERGIHEKESLFSELGWLQNSDRSGQTDTK